MVAAAASILIVSSVKVARQTMELIKSEMHHQLPDQRINALLRFQVYSGIFGHDISIDFCINRHCGATVTKCGNA